MEKQLLKILQCYLSKQDSKLSGLFVGDMGICLALYLLNKRCCDMQVEEDADRLLDKIIDSIKVMQLCTFDQGIAGIGWAINILHTHHCIDGDIDDILYNVDAQIYKHLCKDNQSNLISSSNGLIGYLIYIVFRLKNKNHKQKGFLHSIDEAMLRILVDKLEISVPYELKDLNRDLFISCLWDFPILFFCLGNVLELGIYNKKIENMIGNWTMYITSEIPYNNINRLALANSLIFLNKKLVNKKIASHIGTLYSSVDFEELVYEIDERVININEGWFYCLFCVCTAQKMMDKNHLYYPKLEPLKNKLLHTYFERFQKSLNDPSNSPINITLINGLSGISIMYVLFPDMFRCNIK